MFVRCLRLQSFPTCSASYLAFSTAKEFLLGQRSGMALSQRAASVTGSAAARSGDDEVEAEERQYTNFLLANGMSTALLSRGSTTRSSENVLVVHPRIRWGENAAPQYTNAQLQLDEAVTLCGTLPFFNVVETVIVGTDYNTKKKLLWGEGRLEKLKSVKLQTNATVIMINVAMLTPLQQTELSAYFEVPIYDRYNVVLCIFKIYARTREAHLQISLAEIPYIRHRIRYMCNNDASANVLHINDSVVDGSKTDEKLELLRLREHLLRKRIRKVVDAKVDECERRAAKGNALVRGSVVAVIGYTNAGKTSLIKRLTNSTSIFGENRLFATLDTTVYTAQLPSDIRVMLADTIGFISDLPIELFASFSATLRHVMKADVLVHVQDLSHPNLIAQHKNVLETLKGLRIGEHLIETMIHVGNKVDRTSRAVLDELEQCGEFGGRRLHKISCRTGEGMPELIRLIDMAAQRVNGSKLRRLKLLPTSRSVSYLYENNMVTKEPQFSECGKFLVFDILMNDSQMAKFQANLSLKLKQKT